MFRKKLKSNDEAKIRVVATGNTYSGGRTFYILYAPTPENATPEQFAKVFGTDYADKILGGSWLYFDDKSKKIWNEEEEIFK